MERCKLVENAQELAKKKGLDPAKVICEFESVCDGTACLKIEPNVTIEPPTPSFYQRLEETTRIKGF